jgi:hypothetical protein
VAVGATVFGIGVRRIVHLFDMPDGALGGLDQIRRSPAIGNGLTRSDVERLLEIVDELVAERAEVRRTLDDPVPSWQSSMVARCRMSSPPLWYELRSTGGAATPAASRAGRFPRVCDSGGER